MLGQPSRLAGTDHKLAKGGPVGRMAEVTYYVALPFVASDDGVAAGEPTECFNPVAVVMRAEALSRKEGHVGARSRFAGQVILFRAISATPR